MEPHWNRTLRTAACAAVVCLLLAACSDRSTPAPPAPAPSVAPAPAPATTQTAEALRRLLDGAEFQAENEAQRAELRRALQDLRDKPAAELPALRYAGADGTPGQRSLAELLRAHVVPAQPTPFDLEAWIADRATPDGRARLDAALSRLGAPGR